MDTDELNRFIRQLNSKSEPSGKEDPEETPHMELVRGEEPGAAAQTFSMMGEIPESSEGLQRLKEYLSEVIHRGATDLLLVPGAPPTLRYNGRLIPLKADPLMPEDAASFLLPSLSGERRRRYDESGVVDLSMSMPPHGRFRINLHRTRGGSAAALRLLPRAIPGISELGLPSSIEQLTRMNRGLILVTGPTGCGKSTTLAAMIHEINRRESLHIVTIEDPVEYEHIHRSSIIEQIEIGTDTATFPEALRAALRQDPDVILVGEMRDLETVSTVLTAAETGHLVLTTAHTNDAAQTVHRIVDVFPTEKQPQIRQQLSMALSAIVFQQLLVTSDGRKRVVVTEILIANEAVRSHIRKGALHHLHTEMTLGRKSGMMTLEQSLAQRVKSGLITEEDAALHAIFPDELASLLK